MSDAKMIRAVPAPDRRVRHPDDGHVLPPEGEDVADSSFWRRRELDGDVVIEAAEEAPAKESSVKPARSGGKSA